MYLAQSPRCFKQDPPVLRKVVQKHNGGKNYTRGKVKSSSYFIIFTNPDPSKIKGSTYKISLVERLAHYLLVSS